MKKKSILFVDDEMTIRKSLTRDLKSTGYEVLPADSGGTALEIMERRPVDLVITDLMMEGLDGFQVLKNSDEKNIKLCDQIVKSSEQIATLVETINSYVATTERPLSIEKVNPEEIIRMIQEEFAEQFKKRCISWLGPEGLPVIRADRLALARVFRNLVDNALKYGGDKLSKIEVGYRESDDCHIFSVRDDGVGLKKINDNGIFRHFSRRETGKNVEGTGLGLSIVKEIAELHQGSAWVDPVADKGISFCISLSKNL